MLGLMALRKSGPIVQLIVRLVDIQEQHTAQLQQHTLTDSTVIICHPLHSKPIGRVSIASVSYRKDDRKMKINRSHRNTG